MSEHDERDEREDFDDELRTPVKPPEQLVRLATGLWLMAVIQLVFLVVFFVVLAYAFVSSWADRRVGQRELHNVYWQFLALFLAAGWNGLLIWGVGRMERCQGYRVCFAIAALSIIPVPCFLFMIFTLPLGLCTMIEMTSDDVRSAFKSGNRRQKPAPPLNIDGPPDK